MQAQAVSALPGVGYQTEQKLKEAGLKLVSDIQVMPPTYGGRPLSRWKQLHCA